jgi:GntR family transcriptional regulator
MYLRIDTESPVPPYEQLREQLATMITTGVLVPGTRLPPIRQLVVDLGLAPNTVGRTFRELEHQGLIRTRGRHGTFVSETASRTPDERARRLADAATSFVLHARQIGAGPDEALHAITTALASSMPDQGQRPELVARPAES